MQKRRQVMRKFVKLIKLFPLHFPTYKIHVNVSPTISGLYFMFDLLLPFMDRYVFLRSTQFSIVYVVEFVRSLVTRHYMGRVPLSNKTLEVPKLEPFKQRTRNSFQLYFSVFSLFLVSIEKIYQTHNTVFDDIIFKTP